MKEGIYKSIYPMYFLFYSPLKLISCRYPKAMPSLYHVINTIQLYLLFHEVLAIFWHHFKLDQKLHKEFGKWNNMKPYLIVLKKKMV